MIARDTARPDGWPAHLWEGFKLYVFEGVRPGDFMFAFMAGDLFEVLRRGDAEALEGLKQMAAFVYNECPPTCYGDRETVKDWCLMGGLRGIEEDQKE